jgi:hypothetical protein
MNNPRFSQEEFDKLFPGPFESAQERLREYHTFLRVLDQLDRVPVPGLSAVEKADIFRQSWRQRPEDQSWVGAFLAFFRRPARAFVLGLALGGALMFGCCLGNRPARSQPALADPPFAVEGTGCTQVYSGRIVQELYPQIENPRMVVEKAQESSPPQRVLYGTLDGGEVYVAWNL